MNLTSIAPIILAGNRNTVDVFYPISGNIFIASIFAISTFGGLNGVIPLSMESRDPRKTVAKSLIIVSIILGIAIIMNSYAQTIIFGPSNMSYYSSIPDPGILIYSEYLYPIISFILILFVINSFFELRYSCSKQFIENVIWWINGRCSLPKILFINKQGMEHHTII